MVMSLSVMGANHRLKEREPSLYLDCQTLQMLCKRSKNEPVEHNLDM